LCPEITRLPGSPSDTLLMWCPASFFGITHSETGPLAVSTTRHPIGTTGASIFRSGITSRTGACAAIRAWSTTGAGSVVAVGVGSVVAVGVGSQSRSVWLGVASAWARVAVGVGNGEGQTVDVGSGVRDGTTMVGSRSASTGAMAGTAAVLQPATNINTASRENSDRNLWVST
jgi:hypothetical protein